jgi:hypothetical protein
MAKMASGPDGLPTRRRFLYFTQIFAGYYDYAASKSNGQETPCSRSCGNKSTALDSSDHIHPAGRSPRGE